MTAPTTGRGRQFQQNKYIYRNLCIGNGWLVDHLFHSSQFLFNPLDQIINRSNICKNKLLTDGLTSFHIDI